MAEEKADPIDQAYIELLGEMHKLVKKMGLKKAVIHLRSVNINKKETEIINNDINKYEHIIKSVISTYGITEKQLYESKERFDDLTNSRTSCYVLINKYLKYSQKSIAIQFGKTRESVCWGMMQYNKMINDKKFFPDFIDNHTKCEELVLQFLESRKTNKKEHK